MAIALLAGVGSASASGQVISSVAASSVTNSSAVITWTTNQPSSSLVNYGVTTSYGSASPVNGTLVTAHSVTLSGLAANTLYDFDVVSSSSLTSTGTSTNFRFATLAVAPLLTNINVIFITSNSATINWTTDQPATGMVNYGPTTSYGSSSALNSTMTIAHSVTLNGLSPSTKYDFDVVSAGLASVNSTSSNQTFTTPSASATAPNVGYAASWDFTNSTAMLSWSTDVPANTVLAYGTTTALGQLSPVQSALTANHGLVLTGLNPGTTYYYVAESTGANGTIGYSPMYSLVTTGTPSLVPIVSNVATSNLTGTSATITWTTDAPSTSQINYGATPSYGFSTPLDPTLTTNHSVTLTGLTPNTRYDYQLVSVSTTGVSTFGANLAGKTVWAWGDSLTLGYGDLSTNSYPIYLTTLIGSPVANEAVGGTTSTQIAAAMLGTPAALTPGNCNLIWSGGNNHNDVSTVLSDVASMVSALQAPSCYLVLGDINPELDPLGTPDYNNILATNQGEASAYGSNYMNIREGLVQDYNPALPLDQWTYANDIPADSLHAVRAQGTITSGALNSSSCAISISDGTNGVGTVIIIDSESILVNALSDSLDVSACTRGYNGTAAASHLANATYSLVDPTHLGSNGYDFVAEQVAAWFEAQFPLNFTTPAAITTGPAISGVSVSSITSTSAVVSWTTDQASTSLVNYGVTNGYGSASTLNPALTTSHTVSLTGLTAGTTYDFDVVSANSGGMSTTSGNSSFATTAPGPVISNVATTNVASTSVTVTWTTDQPASSLVNYGTSTAYGASSTLNSTLGTSHTVILTGLTPGTAYDFDVVSANAGGLSTTSANAVFATESLSSLPPEISNVATTNVTSSSVTVIWTTDQPSSSLVNYGATAAYGASSTLNSTLVTSHSVTLTGLSANALYDFEVVSSGTAVNTTTTSANFLVATLSAAPIIGNVNVEYITSSSATINWTTDVPSSGMVNYGTTTGYGSTSALNSTLSTTHSMTLSGLTPSTTYNFDVVSAASASSTSANQTFATGAASVTAPNISYLGSYGYSNTGATISWSTDVPATTVVAYGTTTALGQFSPVQSTLSSNHGVVLTGLAPGTTYYYVASSTGANGAAGYSAESSFTTTGTFSLVPIISNVASSNLTPTSATITWTTNVPSNSLVNYGTTTSYGSTAVNSALTTAHTVTLTGLTPGTGYVYQVVSADAAGSSSFGASLTGITIWAWGDSQTLGGKDGSNINYPDTLTNLLGVPVINEGEGGDTSTQIAARMLATPASFGPGNCNVIWAGSNNPTQVSQILADDASMVNALAAPPCYLVLGDVNFVSTPIGTTTYNDIVTTSADLAAAYPNNYLNIRELVVQDYNPSLPMDVADHAEDVMPSSLRAVVSTGTITSGALDSASCAFSVSSGTQGPGTVIIVDSETILINAIPDGLDVTSCTRGYNLTAAASHAANATYFVIDPIHLGYNGLEFVASQVANWFQSQSWPLCTGTGLICPFPANFTTPTTAGPAISAVTASNITTTSAVITWTTDQASSSQVNYGVTNGYGSASTLNSTLVTSHTVTLTGLTPGTTYDFDVVSVNATAQSTTSGNSTFATATTPPVISSVGTTGATQTSVTATWTTDEPSSSQVNYGTTTGYGSSSTLNSTLVTSHTVTLTGLTLGTTYDFDVVSANAAAQSTTSGNSTFATTTPPPVISSVSTNGATQTTVTVTWTTDQASTSQVNYGVTNGYGSSSTLNSTLVTSHTVTLTGLTPGTTYDFDVVSANAGATSSTSGNSTFATSVVTSTPPVISNVGTTGVSQTTVTVTWTTDQPASSQVNYGVTNGYGSSSPVNTSLVTAHVVTITGLAAGTAYDFDVVSANAAAQSTTSPNATVTTPAVNATAPYVGYVAAWGINNSSATVTWSTDVAATGQLAYGTSTALGQLSPLQATMTASHGVVLSGLVSGTTYYFVCQSTGANGTTGYSAVTTFTTTGTAPAGPPVISNVLVSAITNTSAMISWSTDQASTSLVNFGTTAGYGSASTLNSTLTTAHSVTLTGLTLGTTYDFDVVSANAGAMSSNSGNATFATTSVVTLPPAISNVLVGSITNTTATVTWTTDEASSSLVNYGTTNAYGSASPLDPTLVTSHSVMLTGLTQGTTYDFDVVSANSGLMSTTSGNAAFATTAVTSSPPVISNVATTSVSQTSVTVTWTTDEASSSQVNYGVTNGYGSSSTLNSTLVTAHSVTLSGLTAGTTYDFDVTSANATAQSSTSPNSMVTTTAANATPPFVGYVAAWGINNSNATVTWSTDVAANTQLAYGTTNALGQLSPVQTAMTASHGVSLTGLASGTTYYYVCQSTAANGATGYSAVMSFTTTGTQSTPPPVISNVTASGMTNTTAIITWTTDQATTSQVNYGLSTAYTLSSTLNQTLVTSHSVTLTGLNPGATYDFDVVSTDSSAVSTTSNNATFITTGTAPAPVISNVSFSGVTSGTATITWTTDEASSSVVNYGATSGYGSTTSVAALVTSHSVTLTGLTPNTTYNFDVASANAANASSTSGNFTFKTTSNTAPPPMISYLNFWGVNATGVTIAWSTDVPANTAVAYGTTNALGQLSPVQTALTNSHGVVLTGLNSGTTYYFVAQSADGSGNTGYSTTYSFTTLPGPPTISGVTATPGANHTATISWTTSVATTSYVLFGPTTSYGFYSPWTGSTTTPSCALSYVPSGTVHYQVVSTDANGNQVASADMTFTEP
jgi:hypothetical protein